MIPVSHFQSFALIHRSIVELFEPLLNLCLTRKNASPRMVRLWGSVAGLSLIAALLPAVAIAHTDVSNMTDAAFFGQWNSGSGSWTTVGKLDYAGFAGLDDTQNYVKAGNYSAAKTALLTYFRNRTTKISPAIGSAPNSNAIAELVKDNVLTATGEIYMGEITVGTSYGEVTCDVLSGVTAAYAMDKKMSFMLMGRYKDDANKTFYSRSEGTHPPTLSVVVNGSTVNLTATLDNYIRAGSSYKDDNYGTETLLHVKSWGYPFDEYERRSYLQFDMSGLAAAPTSATLKLWGRSNAADAREVVVYYSENNTWTETGQTWENTSGGTLSWDGLSAGTDWAPASTANDDGVYNGWIDIMSTFPFIKRLSYEYNLTSNESYATKSVEMMLDFISDQGNTDPGYNISITAARRIPAWISAFDYLVTLESSSLDGNACSAILKQIHQTADWLADTAYEYPDDISEFGDYWTAHYHAESNHGVMEASGLFKTAVYFPEFAAASGWQLLAEERAEDLIRTLNYPDGSYIEATPSYAWVAFSLFTDIKSFGEMNGESTSAYYDASLKRMFYYFFDMATPTGNAANYGDGEAGNYRSYFSGIAELFDDDPRILHFGSGGSSGTAPSYTSTFYPYDQTAIMRSDWSDDALFMHIATKTFEPSGTPRVHRHLDMLSVIVSAYGAVLLPDNGRKGYDSDEETLSFKKTQAHNTIEIDNADQSDTGSAGVTMWASNAGTDFYEGFTTAASTTAGFTSTRSVLFIKPSFWIISDYIDAISGSHRYEQNWHMMPAANPTMDGTTKRAVTTFASDPNLQIVPVDPASLSASLENSKYVPSINAVQDSKRASYVQTVSGDVTFDTVLFPTDGGVTPPNVVVTRLTTSPSVGTTTATAFQIDLNSGASGNTGYYYLSHEATPTTARSFSDYNYNGKLAYVEETSSLVRTKAILIGGKELKDSGVGIITSSATIKDIFVGWSGATVTINGASLTHDTSAGAIAIYAPSTSTVLLNGTSVGFTQTGNYVYAAGVLAGTDTYYAVADAGVRDGGYAGTNFGSDITMEVKVSGTVGYNRRSFCRFDFSSAPGNGVSNAKLRLYLNSSSTTGAKTIAVSGNYDETWGEGTINWSNAPENSQAISTAVLTVASQYYEWDVTAYVNQHWQDKVVSLSLDLVSGPSEENLAFRADESGSDKPQLVLTP